MWYISNTYNATVLSRYNEYLIKSLFELLIDLSKIQTINVDLETPEFLQNQFNANAYLDDRLLSINRSSTDKILPLLKEIIRLGTNILEHEYTIYTNQNIELNNKNFNLVRVIHPEPIKKLFKDYIYDKFWGENWIWKDIVGQNFNRTKFHSNFKTENKLTTCPYCDIDTITEPRNSSVEHFLPKGKFPYIACNPNNLIPSCSSCNVPGSGKGTEFVNPITTPYNEEIGDKIIFNLENGEIKIDESVDTTIENYIELLKLRARYKDAIVFNTVFSVLKDNYNLATQTNKGHDFEKDVFLDYLYDIGRKRGLYFAQKSLLGNIDEILLMNL